VKKNFFLVAGSLFTLFLFGELVLFRWFLLPSDIPNIEQDSQTQVLKYRSGEGGVWRIRDHTRAQYRINNKGWNSARDYEVEKTSKKRIAIIGDSYIEALQVDYTDSLAERLEGKANYEVLRFGISGAPLSQYLFMYEHEVLRYKPDLVVFNIVNNDFLESFKGSQSGTFTNSFAKWELHPDGSVHLVMPAPYRWTFKTLIKKTATFRYLVARMHVRPETIWRRISATRSKLMGGTRSAKGFEGNIDVAQLDHEKVLMAISIFVDQLKGLTEERVKVVILMDGKRDFVELDCLNSYSNGAMAFAVEKMRDEVTRAGFEFIELGPVFKASWCSGKTDLSVRNDGHWTKYAHDLVATHLQKYLSSLEFGGSP
jgi:hypothetical protein